MLRKSFVVSLFISVPILGFAQARPAPSSLEGVWKVAEIVTTGANASTNSNPQPSLVIFTKGYYTYLSVNTTQPRSAGAPPKDPNHLTDAEKIARYEQWEPYTAQGGFYELKGTTMTRRPFVAKNPALMTTNPPIVQEYKFDGNTLWLITKSAAGQPARETRTKLTRTE